MWLRRSVSGERICPGGLTALAVTVALALLAFADQARSTPSIDVAMAARLFSLAASNVTVSPATGQPPAHEVRAAGRLVGYIASTWQAVRSSGYSGAPVDIAVAVGLDGKIAGAQVLAQSEPVLILGISRQQIARHVAAFKGIDLRLSTRQMPPGALPNIIAGASISKAVIQDGILRTAREVAISRHLLGTRDAGARLKRTVFEPLDWRRLKARRAVALRTISVGEVRKQLGEDYLAASGVDGDAVFAELAVALATPAIIGQNLLGRKVYTRALSQAGGSDNFIVIAANGLYSFKGARWRKSGVFERIELQQGATTLQFVREGYTNVEKFAAEGAPNFREIGLFRIPAESRFDPVRPFTVSFIAPRSNGEGARRLARFTVEYRVPDFLVAADSHSATATKVAEEEPVWAGNWERRIPAIVTLVTLVFILAVILVFQDTLARRARLYMAVRLAFLASTVVIIGLVLGGQLSVVQVLAFAQALRTGFRWEVFLLDPVIFILWGFVAVAMLFWGRGVFCGWLCPFGALQELLNAGARALKVRQVTVPFSLHERLWPIKYIIFLGLFALSLKSLTAAFTYAEVEPFKTVFAMKLQRTWPFLAFVAALLLAGLVIERFYCRYLCPLGAALALPARLRMFEWLKRRPQCGRECRICATRCTVEAIHPDGHINPNECIHCLRCQVVYYNDRICPPLKARRLRRMARHKAIEAASRREAAQ